MVKNKTTDRVYDFLIKDLRMTPEGAAGYMGNLYAESAIDPTTVEGLLCQRYSEDGDKAYARPVNTGPNRAKNNALYTERIDTGFYSFSEFMSPRGRHYGYGLIQSTTERRKELLWQHTRGMGKSIADLEGQLSYIKEEFALMYPSILRQLQVIRSVEEAAVLVLKKYEAPAGADAMRTTRIGYARYYYDAYKDYKAGKKEEERTMGAVEKLLAVAAEELGYLEKRSNANLDSKTGNAGSGNFTKYWRDLKPSFQGQAWCDAFVDWCFRQAFGAEMARKLLCGGYLIFYTPDSANAFKRANRWHTSPAVGDQIFFKNSQRICHTGIVIGVTGDRVITIEGNTSGASGVVANGGGVCKKSYDLNHPRIAGYGRPDWSLIKKGDSFMFELGMVEKGKSGSEAELMQRLLKSKGYKDRDGKELAVDGQIGDRSIQALKAFQAAMQLDQDGQCGPQTWKKLLGI